MISEFILVLDELETPATPLFLNFIKLNNLNYIWVSLSSSLQEFNSISKKWGVSPPIHYENIFAEWSSMPTLKSLLHRITKVRSDAICIDDVSSLCNIYDWKQVLLFIDDLWEWCLLGNTSLILSAHSDLSGAEDLDIFRRSLQYTATSTTRISKLPQGPVAGITGQIVSDNLIFYELKDSGFSKWVTKGNV